MEPGDLFCPELSGAVVVWELSWAWLNAVGGIIKTVVASREAANIELARTDRDRDCGKGIWETNFTVHLSIAPTTRLTIRKWGKKVMEQ